jgi:hypothetical protein
VAVDEFLQDKRAHLKNSAEDMELNVLHSFAALSNPETRQFIDKMDDMIGFITTRQRFASTKTESIWWPAKR